MVGTSYWGNLKNLDSKVVVNISRWNRFWKGEDCEILKPNVKMLIDYKNGKIDEKVYTYYFKWYLWGLDVKEVYDSLDGKILCCYEKVGFCHRHIVREWFKYFGLECEEVKILR